MQLNKVMELGGFTRWTGHRLQRFSFAMIQEKNTPEGRNRKEGPELKMNLGMFLVQRLCVKRNGRNTRSKEQDAESVLAQNKRWEDGHQCYGSHVRVHSQGLGALINVGRAGSFLQGTGDGLGDKVKQEDQLPHSWPS